MKFYLKELDKNAYNTSKFIMNFLKAPPNPNPKLNPNPNNTPDPNPTPAPTTISWLTSKFYINNRKNIKNHLYLSFQKKCTFVFWITFELCMSD